MTKSFRQQVLQDTKNPAIANSYGMETFVKYHDYNEEFTRFVRPALLVTDHEIPGKVNRRRTWRSVADYNGLIARDFLRCQNRVFPAKWMQNSRSQGHYDDRIWESRGMDCQSAIMFSFVQYYYPYYLPQIA